MARLSRNDGMYWGELTDIIHPLFPIGIRIPKSIGSPLGSAHHGGLFSEAEQRLERHKRRDIPSHWRVRHHAGEARAVPTGPTSPRKTHGRISGSVPTTGTLHMWCAS